MSTFIETLESLNEKDTRVRAVLRRSLAFDPGEYPPAYPYVEPFVKDEDSPWTRKMFYLVAGLWASHWREGQAGGAVKIAKACATYQSESGSTSTERRFIALLDADGEQLPHHLRQMISLLKEQPLDFDALLKETFHWNDDHKRIQLSWARDYYRNIDSVNDTEQFPDNKEKNI